MNAERWRLVDSILARALDLPQDERRDYLARSCGADDELRRQVERLLMADREAGRFLETPPFDELEKVLAEATKGSCGDAGVATLPAGTTVARYVVEARLGAGGMGTVYAALDPELERTVALKLVRPESGSGPSRERLLREAQALARVSHPNVVTVYDVGHHGDGVFLAMEHMGGGTLADWLQSAERDRRQILDAFLAAGRGLAAAHAAGIVHRDFKPSNVLRDADGRLRVADFGLARAASTAPATTAGRQTGPAGDEPRRDAGDGPGAVALYNGDRSGRLGSPLTGTGWRLGTPTFMAPEQHAGGEVGPATDQFAFCVALYHALYGEHPFAGDTPAETRARVLAGNVALPAKAHRVPRWLRSALLRGMQVRPEQRWPSMQALLQVLERGARRRSRLLPVAAALLIPLLAASLWWLAGGRPGASAPAASTPSVAVLPFENLGAQPQDDHLSEGMTDELIAALVGVQPLRVPARSSVYALRGKSLTPQEMADRLGVEHLLEGSVRREGDRLRVTARLVDAEDGFQLWSQTYDRRLADVFEVEDDIARAIVAQLQVRLVESEPLVTHPTENLEAYSLYLKGRSHWNRRTAESLRTAIAFFAGAIEEDPGYAEAYSGLADAYVALPTYDPNADAEALVKARTAAERALELDPESAEAHASLGMVHYWNGDSAQAERQLQRAIELEPRYATAHHWYGRLLVGEHRAEAAVEELELARRLDPASSAILAGLAHAYYEAGRHERALETELALKQLDPEWSPRDACIARTYIALRRYDEAVAAVADLDEPRRRSLFCQADLALAHHLRGDYEAELAVAREALADYPGYPMFLEAEGAALAALGRVEEVREMFTAVVDEAEPQSFSRFALYNLLGELRVHGHGATARDLARLLVSWHRRHPAPAGAPPVLGFNSALGVAVALAEADQPAGGGAELGGWLAAARQDELAQTRLSDFELAGLEGWAAALQGRRRPALASLRALDGLESGSETAPYRAFILAALGEGSEAVAALQRRLDRGLVPGRDLHVHVGLRPLDGSPEAQRLLSPGRPPSP